MSKWGDIAGGLVLIFIGVFIGRDSIGQALKGDIFSIFLLIIFFVVPILGGLYLLNRSRMSDWKQIN